MPPSTFTMPPIAKGDVVLWKHNHGSAEQAPAIVTDVGQSGISVLMFAPGQRQGTVRDGVRHSTDPANKTVISSDVGVWDYTETHLKWLTLFAPRATDKAPSSRPIGPG